MVGCHGYALCIAGCIQNSTDDASFGTCQNGCDGKTNQTSGQKLDAVYACAVTACVAAKQCTDMNDTSQTCGMCVDAASAKVFGLPCPGGQAICANTSCDAQINACLADTP
jgi:hypothetical protein